MNDQPSPRGTDAATATPTAPAGTFKPTAAPWIPYVAPMVTFLVLTSIESELVKLWGTASQSAGVVGAYTIKIVLTALVAILCRRTWRDFFAGARPDLRAVLAAVGLGVVVIVAWVGLDPYYPRVGILGTRTAFDPAGLPPGLRVAWFVLRGFGLVLVVPLIEELFWRSFLMRWSIDPDFERVPVGRVTPVAALVTSAAFAAVHPEWLPALLTGLAWAGLLAWSRSLASCWISHMVANAALGAYVLATGAWKFL